MGIIQDRDVAHGVITDTAQVISQALFDQLSVQVTRLPMGNFFAGTGIIFVFIVVIGVVALLVAGDKLKLPLK